MVKRQLVSLKEAEGERLLRLLDQSDFPVNSALWFFFEDEEWRLVLATSLVDSEGPRGAYERLQNFLTQSSPDFDLSLEEVTLVGPRHSLLEILRRAIVTGPGISRVRFTESTVDNVFIDDALIYRVAADPDWNPQNPVAAS